MATKSKQRDMGGWQLVSGVVGIILLAAMVDSFLPEQWMRVLYYSMAALSGVTITLTVVAFTNWRLSKQSK